jgi:hypothetical protein
MNHGHFLQVHHRSVALHYVHLSLSAVSDLGLNGLKDNAHGIKDDNSIVQTAKSGPLDRAFEER